MNETQDDLMKIEVPDVSEGEWRYIYIPTWTMSYILMSFDNIDRSI